MFLVTTSGIVLTDPISVEMAQWLKAEFERRFPPGVVRYLVHTSHRSERASGGAMFKDPAEVIGHREFNAALLRARHQAELSYRRVQDAETYFDDTRTITIGGSTIELVHAPSLLAPESTVVVFRGERTAFVGDAPLLEESSFKFGAFKPRDVRRWLATVSSLDFDVLLLGNGRSIPKTRLVKLSAYSRCAIVTRVASSTRPGDRRPSSPKASCRRIDRMRPFATGTSMWPTHTARSVFTRRRPPSSMGHYVVKDNAFCASFKTCSSGGVFPGGMAN